MFHRTKAAVTVSAIVAAVAASFTVASPALANPVPCDPAGSDGNSLCAHVIGINPGSTLSVRSGPGTNFGIIGRLNNGDFVEVECWTTGTPVNGYNIWTQLYSPGAPRYVSDFYLDTGHVQNFLPHC